MLCIFSICTYAQQITVSGTVTDAENNPLIGAAVLVLGTTDGVITDLDGKYTIKVNSGQSLKFSYEEFYKLKYCSTVVYMVPRA